MKANRKFQCFAMLSATLFVFGCTTSQTPHPTESQLPRVTDIIFPDDKSRDRQTEYSQSTPTGIPFDHSVNILIEVKPIGSDVYGVKITGDREWGIGDSIGKTPLEIPIKIAVKSGDCWFKDPNALGGRVWQMKRKYHYHDLNLFIDRSDHYGVFAHIKVIFYINDKGDLVIEEPVMQSQHRYINIGDGEVVKGTLRPILLLEKGNGSLQRLAEQIESGDYYDAEEFRLTRIQALQRQLSENKKFWDKYEDDTEESMAAMTGLVHARLLESELDQLNHLVGLLDSLLMGLRKQLVAKLHEGDVEAALALAKAVEAMEKRYFPPPPPKTIYVNSPATASQQQAADTQLGGKQEIVIQQKPYYGVSNVVQAIGVMQGGKLKPEAYQKALGSAQLLDILGFGASIIK